LQLFQDPALPPLLLNAGINAPAVVVQICWNSVEIIGGSGEEAMKWVECRGSRAGCGGGQTTEFAIRHHLPL